MKKTTTSSRTRSRRGIYILPNIFTSLNLLCGFYAVIASIDGKFVAAAIAIFIGMVFDILDGKIARATRTTSKFGTEYDSLADLISFGLAPGLMIFMWALKPMGRIGWLAAFLFMACGALRLARFNSMVGKVSSDYFVGLPIPAAAGMLAATVLFCNRFDIVGMHPILVLVLLYTLSYLMVSTIKYNSFKKPELFKRMNFNVLVAAILIMIFIASQPPVALFFLMLAYVVSGPFVAVRHYRRQKLEADGARRTGEHGSSPI